MSGVGTPLGTFPVTGAAAEAEAFRRAIGLERASGATLPMTFPMRWLAAPPVRAAILEFIGYADIVLVHESQSFGHQQPLQVDRPYTLSVSARREVAPDRLILDGVVSDAEGDHARIETILRLVALPGERVA